MIGDHLGQISQQLGPIQGLYLNPGEEGADVVLADVQQTAVADAAETLRSEGISVEAVEYAKGRGWTVLAGRAFPAESMVPFSVFSDAFLPVLQGLERDHFSQMVPGGEDAIFALFPALGGSAVLDEFDGQDDRCRSCRNTRKGRSCRA